MKRETLLKLTASEIDEYAEALGVDTSGISTKAKKADAIEAARDSVTEVSAMGFTARIKNKVFKDKSLIDKYTQLAEVDEGSIRFALLSYQLLESLLGDEITRLDEYVTDDDGVKDSDMYGLILGKIFEELQAKN